jgi:very-short-patch-repair endonuclease
MYSQDLSRQRSQTLRKNMTKEERHLWYDFLKDYPVQFKRQYTVGAYIVDFYCYQAKLILELDGSQHCEPETVRYDQQRSNYLEQQGFLVLRISNRDVMTQFRAVCDRIDTTVQNRMCGK